MDLVTAIARDTAKKIGGPLFEIRENWDRTVAHATAGHCPPWTLVDGKLQSEYLTSNYARVRIQVYRHDGTVYVAGFIENGTLVSLHRITPEHIYDIHSMYLGGQEASLLSVYDLVEILSSLEPPKATAS